MNFFPTTAKAPSTTHTDRLLLRPLTVDHVELDYDAVMASREQLRTWSQTSWPTEDFTLAENLADLERHQREHNEGVAFTYTLLNPTESRCLGCVYLTSIPDDAAPLFPPAGYGIKVTFWIRSDEAGRGLEEELLATLRAWFAAEWHVDQVAYTISKENSAQAELLGGAGLLYQGDTTLADGRVCRVYAE